MTAFAPNYETRKRVEAHPIASVGAKAVLVELPNGDTRSVAVPPGFSARPPAVGDMLVRYADGYLSHCPADVFLRDATAIAPERVAVVEEPRVPRFPLGGRPHP
ncbi:hypothetical protein [uncultured Methylobacterium sp.]|uniref:hypothetical protein n=1 Tax=uncultured Methylobacterium sp. TaxID=157278 RepID=UPI0035CAACA3